MTEDLLIRFLSKKCSGEDLQKINCWIKSDPTNAQWLFEIEQIWSFKDELKFSDETEIKTAYTHFLNSIQHKDKESWSEKRNDRSLEPSLFKPKSTKKSKWNYWWNHAAAAVIICIISLNLYQLTRKEEISMNEIIVPKGQTIILKLSDGTRVWLNADTKFTYPSSFNENNRTVKISGEGFFEVAHNEKSPFIVESNFAKTKVLGTKFNIKAYNNENTTITLLEGGIEILPDNKKTKHPLQLKPNQQAIVSEKEDLIIRDCVDAFAISQWTSGELFFMNESLGNIASTLERKFKTKITIKNRRLAGEAFNSHIRKEATLEEILEILKATRKLNYKMENQSILLFN